MTGHIIFQKKNIFLAISFIFLISLFLFIGFAYYLLSPLEKGGYDRDFFVREGATLKDVAKGLEKNRIIKSSGIFQLWARISGVGRSIKAGEYRLNPGMPPLKVLEILNKGLVITCRVTIPEGYTRKQIGELLEKKGLVNRREFISNTGSHDLAKRYGINAPDLEGYLYPDTYRFSKGMPVTSIIHVMVSRFWEVTTPLSEKIKESRMTTNEVVTLASIVEKETGLDRERSLIASVFLNRLKKKMRIESDPTVIYGIKDFNGNLTRKDLVSHTKYNTYVIRGLPPGPIANPGLASIKAVLYPAKSDYLYFVSRNDGSHCFSSKFSDHNRAVKIYQKKRRSRK